MLRLYLPLMQPHSTSIRQTRFNTAAGRQPVRTEARRRGCPQIAPSRDAVELQERVEHVGLYGIHLLTIMACPGHAMSMSWPARPAPSMREPAQPTVAGPLEPGTTGAGHT